MFRKVKAIFIGAAIFLVAGLGTYLSTDVDWVGSFGPGIGGIVLAAVGYFVSEGIPQITAYLEKQKSAP